MWPMVCGVCRRDLASKHFLRPLAAMREILHIQLGQCGNQAGNCFWQDIISEHGLDAVGKPSPGAELQRVEVYFNELEDGRHIPRAVLADMEPSAIESVRGGPLGGLFRPDNVVVSYSGAGNNWAKGHYTLGAEILEPTLEVIRREAEACECLQGIHLTHALGGGTGSGFGSLVLSRLREEFTDRIIGTFSIFPSTKISNTVVEPYNAVLATSYLIENTDAVHVIDNEALGHIAMQHLKLPSPTFNDFNKIIAQAMSGITCSLRFPGQLNSDLRKLCVNLVPFPRLHFFTTAIAPLCSTAMSEYTTTSMADTTAQLFHPDRLLCRHRGQRGRYLTASVAYRGKVSMQEVDEHLFRIQDKQSSAFVEWIPNNIKSCVCNVAPAGTNLAATFLGNSTGVQELLGDLTSQFGTMFRKRAFLHWYMAEGLDELELCEAENDLVDLAREYQQHEGEAYEDDHDGEDEYAESTAASEDYPGQSGA